MPDDQQLAKARLGSIATECDQLKATYDECFLKYFPEFLKGTAGKNDPCKAKLKAYQDCLRPNLELLDLNLDELNKQRLT